MRPADPAKAQQSPEASPDAGGGSAGGAGDPPGAGGAGEAGGISIGIGGNALKGPLFGPGNVQLFGFGAGANALGALKGKGMGSSLGSALVDLKGKGSGSSQGVFFP